MGNNGQDSSLFDTKTLEGEGKCEMVVFAHQGLVIQRFREARLWIGFNPQNAVDIAKQFIDMAVTCGANVQIQFERPKISPMKHAMLVTRTAHVLRDLQDKGKSPKYIAQHVVDIILSAID